MLSCFCIKLYSFVNHILYILLSLLKFIVLRGVSSLISVFCIPVFHISLTVCLLLCNPAWISEFPTTSLYSFGYLTFYITLYCFLYHWILFVYISVPEFGYICTTFIYILLTSTCVLFLSTNLAIFKLLLFMCYLLFLFWSSQGKLVSVLSLGHPSSPSLVSGLHS